MYGYRSGSTCSEIRCKNIIDNPLDTVHYIIWDQFRINERSFLACGWDGFIRYFEIQGQGSSQQIICKWKYFFDSPVISCDINQEMIVFAGLATGQIAVVNMRTSQNGVIGMHDAPICGIYWVKQFKILISVGFDTKIKIWSLQQQNNNFLQLELNLSQKISTCSFDFPYLLLGSIGSKVAIISIKDLPNINIPTNFHGFTNLQIFSKFRSSKINSMKKKIILGTQDGRTVFSQFSDYSSIKIQTPTISKSQKTQQYRKSYLWPVSTVDIGVHNSITYYAIGGTINLAFFNFNKKQKIKTIKPSHNTPITASCISPRGDYVAYAYGNDWTEGLLDLKYKRQSKINVTKFTMSELDSFISTSKY